MDNMEIALIAAAVVAMLHVLSIAYVCLGGFLALRDPRWLVPHLAAVTWIVVGGALLAVCPLTALEKWLIVQAGETPYDGYFISHYLVGRVYPEAIADQMRDLAAVVILASWATVVHRQTARRPSVAA